MKTLLLSLLLAILTFNIRSQDTLKLACNNFREWQLERIMNKSDYRNKIVRSGYYISEYHPEYLVMSKKSKYMYRLGDFSNVINDLLLEGKIQEIINNYFPGFYK